MELIINGYSQIIKEIKKDLDSELEIFKQEFDQKQNEIKSNYKQLEEKETERIVKETKKKIETEYRKKLATAKVEIQEKILDLKEDKTESIILEVKEKINSLSPQKRDEFINSKLASALQEMDEEIESIEITKGTKLTSTPSNVKINDSLKELGFIINTKSGVSFNHTFNILFSEKEDMIRKIISDKLF